MLKLKLIGGREAVVNLAAPSAVERGQVVAVGDLAVIAKDDLASGEYGSFAVGGGIYSGTHQDNAGTTDRTGKPCFFDAAQSNIRGTVGKRLGEVVKHADT
ncbi:MAG: capsid cement protein, partial [Planctomycetota bacterium]